MQINAIYCHYLLAQIMSYSLSERILAMAQHNEGLRRRCNFPLLLAQREQILLSLRDGWSLIQIWEMLRREGKVTSGYATFTRQVRRMLPKHDETPQPLPAPLIPWPKPGKPTEGFSFNSTPSKEDLL